MYNIAISTCPAIYNTLIIEPQIVFLTVAKAEAKCLLL